MKIIRNNIIPFAGYKAMNLFGVLFVRGNARIDDITLNHEKIHTSQIKELLYIPFYLFYILEYAIRAAFYGLRFLGRLIRDKNRKFRLALAYRKISFEREAYANQHDLDYLKSRKRFNFTKYLK